MVPQLYAHMQGMCLQPPAPDTPAPHQGLLSHSPFLQEQLLSPASLFRKLIKSFLEPFSNHMGLIYIQKGVTLFPFQHEIHY